MKMRNISLKQPSIFLIGFLIGFNLAFIYYFLQKCSNIYGTKSNKLQVDDISFNSPRKELYKKWLQEQHVFSMDLDLDSYLYGPVFNTSKNARQMIESEWMKGKVHITCVVTVDKANMIDSIKDTWGKRCNKLYFFGRRKKMQQQFSKTVIYSNEKIESSWHHLCEILNHIWIDDVGKNKIQWVIFVNEDTLVVSENLRFLVAPLNFEKDYYLGHAISIWRQKYNMAQAGYVLSRGALKKLVTKFNTSDECAKGGRFWKMEDFYLGKHLESLNIYPSDTRDSAKRGIFHGYSLPILMWGVARPTNYWTKALYPTSSASCCSPMSVTFTVNESDKLYTFNYLLYHFHVLTNLGIYGNLPAPTPMPEEEVWKLVLKDEFGLNNITKISQEEYFNIWRSMYSEPEDFIARNFNTKSPNFRRNDTFKTRIIRP